MDCTKLEFLTEKFDVVVSFEVLEHVDHYLPFLIGIRDVLKVGGIAVISTPNALYSTRRNLPKHPFHVKEFEPEELKGLLSLYFSDINLFGQWDRTRLEKIKSIVRRLDVLNLSAKVFPLLKRLIKLIFGKNQMFKVSADEFSIEEDNLEDAPVLLAVCKK